MEAKVQEYVANEDERNHVQNQRSNGRISLLQPDVAAEHSDKARPFVPVHECVSRPPPGVLPAAASSSIKCISTPVPNKATSRFWSVDDLAYPGIPFQVARYLCESSPDLLTRMEAALHKGGVVTKNGSSGASPKHLAFTSGMSTLRHMSSATDALALQESAIGHGTCARVAKLDVVTQAVTAISNQQHLLALPVPNPDKLVRPDPREVTVMDVLDRNTEGSARSVEDFVMVSPSSSHVQSFKNQQDTRWIDSRSTASDIESVFSDRFDLESNCESERFEIQSNVSEVSGLEEEMFRIKKLLLEVPTQEVDPGPILEVLRSKAVLEGELEVLRARLEATLKDKANLEAQLSATLAALGVQTGATKAAKGEVEKSRPRVEQLERQLRDATDLVARLRDSLEAKAEEVDRCRSEVEAVEADLEAIKAESRELKVDAELKDGSIRGLKAKVADLHVDLQNATQLKSTSEVDLKAVESTLAAERKMKDWYKNQLQEVQEAKGKALMEGIAAMTARTEAEAQVERLKRERELFKSQVAEVQLKAVREKETLLRRLETIEADVREREEAYRNLGGMAAAEENTFYERIRKLEDDKAKLTEDAFNKSELERQMALLESEIRDRTDQVAGLEKEMSRLLSAYTVQQKTASEHVLELHGEREKYAMLEAKCKEHQLRVQTVEAKLAAVESEKTNLAIELSAARKDKSEMDLALVDVRNNVLLLNTRLKQMKDELAARASGQELLKRENRGLLDECRAGALGREQLSERLEKAEEEARLLREDIERRCRADRDSYSVLAELEAARHEQNRLRADLDRVVSENRASKDSGAADEELKETRAKFQRAEDEIEMLRKRNVQLEDSVKVLQQVRREVKAESVGTSLDQDVSVRSKLLEQEEAIIAAVAAKQLAESKVVEAEQRVESLNLQVESVTVECVGLRERVAALERDWVVAPLATHDFGTQMEPEEQVKEPDSEAIAMKLQVKRYESNVNLLTRKLKEALRTKKKLEAEVRALQETVAKTSAVTSSPASSANQKSAKETKLGFLRKRLALMENKMSEVQRLYSDEKKRADINQEHLIELEKERGKSHALAESNLALQERTSALQTALSERECVACERDGLTQDALVRLQCEVSDLKGKLEEVSQKLKSELDTNKELRRQIFKEKCEVSGAKKQTKSMRTAMEAAERMLEAKNREMESFVVQGEEHRRAEAKLRLEVAEAEQRTRQARSEMDKLNQELEEGRAKDSFVANQIKTLSWHIHQKGQEIQLLKDQQKKCEEDHGAHMSQAEKALNVANRELQIVKDELQKVLKERIGYQQRVSELRSALKANVDKNRAFSDNKGALDFRLPESPVPYDESQVTALLQQTFSFPENKPLSNLHVCVNTLKQEMAILQQQLLEQTNS